MLSKSYKTIYETKLEKVFDEETQNEVEVEIQVPTKVMAFYKDGVEITEEEYNEIISRLPKPKEPSQAFIQAQQEIELIKQQLADMDYKTSKYVDGDYTETEWQEIVNERKVLRARIKELEKVR